MYKLCVGLCLVGTLVVGLSHLSGGVPAAQVNPGVALSCEINGAALRPGESLLLPGGRALSFMPRAAMIQQASARWRSIEFELRDPDGEQIVNFSELLRSGSTALLGGEQLGSDPVSVRCSF